MKAAVYFGKEELIVQDVPDPVLGAGEVLLAIEACNICGTDMRTYRHGDAKIAPPRILGHEFCGRVIEMRGVESENLAVGDRVLMYIVLPCGQCRYCTMGRSNLCERRTTMSYHYDGAFAQYMAVPARAVAAGNLFKVSDDLPAAQLSLAEPLGCVINAHGRLGIGLKDTVAIIGAGPIGILHALVSRLQGAQKVILLDTSEARLGMGHRFDIDHFVTVRGTGDHVDEVRELTDGIGPSIVIVACSNAEAQNDALTMAGKAARVEFFGGLPKSKPNALLNTNHLHYKELVISGSYSEKLSDFQAAQALVQSPRFDGDKIVTHTLPLAAITDAFPLIESGAALKVCIGPSL